MNVFDAIYLNNNDPIEYSFISAEAAMDIAVDRANKEYVYEMGLIELSDNKLFIEATTDVAAATVDVKKENAFIKAVKAICNAICNFIGDIIASITSIFDGREHITEEDYLKSNMGKVRLAKDVKKIEAVVDDEIRKGNKLLQMISSKTGISDEVIDNWVRAGAEKIGKIAPVVIPMATAWGFKKLFSTMFKNKQKDIKNAEKAATRNKSNTKETSQTMKVLNHMEWLIKQVGDTAKDWGKTMNKAMKKAK